MDIFETFSNNYTRRLIIEHYLGCTYEEFFVGFLWCVILSAIFYLIAKKACNYLIEKEPKTYIYVPLIIVYMTSIPLFVFLFRGNLNLLILYAFICLYGFCSLDNFYRLKKYLSTKTKYSVLFTIIIINMPCFFIIFSQIKNSSKTVIIIGYLSLLLISIIHIFISNRLKKQ